ncbi:alpha/beta hydrolase [Streptomyces hoynatensis]|uniref:Alpha/beta hydrolase n=1 Tax=Streptomyces hoynatensis TaxID=1141874 RepID=A0A3A9YNW7_9ACTN|nr:alpha/beta hydrolase [Streptomyces hoynatensis]
MPPGTRLTVRSTGGARLHVETHGREDAPTVVLAHGWTCDTTLWHPVLRLLLPGHRVVLYDQRGHGRSPATPGNCSPEALADDLCAVLGATLPPGGRAVVAGHSMGAMTVVAAAERPALRAHAAAVLLCSTGIEQLTGLATVFPLREGAARRLAQRLLLTARLPLGPVTPLSRRLLRHVALGPAATRAQCERVARIVSGCAPAPRAEWGRVLARLDLARLLPGLGVPAAVLQGTADRLTPPVHARRIAARLPHLHGLTELPGIGHMTPVEAPGEVAGALSALARAYL